MVVVWCTVAVLRRPGAADVLRWLVLDPVPRSVTSLKIDCPEEDRHGGYVYVLRFGIDRTDLDQVVKSRPFRRACMEYYENGDLGWRWGQYSIRKVLLEGGPLPKRSEGGVAVLIYRPGQRQPSWLDLGSWEDPEMYACQQENGIDPNHSQILIYNKELGQAYFIAEHWGSRGFFDWW